MPKASTNKNKLRNILGNILIWGGIALCLIGVTYEAINYPWTTLFQKLGWVDVPADLPNPASITDEWLTQTPDTLGDVSLLPQEGRTLERPPAHLSMLGVIKLPRISLSDNIVEGTGTQLYYAVGHTPGTALPGQPGNCVLAGHRNYVPAHPFRHLDKMQNGDSIILEDQTNRYVYQVYQSFVVKPTDIWVIEPIEDEASTVTLITCTPVLTMTDRLIVRGRLVSTEALPTT